MSDHPTLDECIETEAYLNDDGGEDDNCHDCVILRNALEDMVAHNERQHRCHNRAHRQAVHALEATAAKGEGQPPTKPLDTPPKPDTI